MEEVRDPVQSSGTNGTTSSTFRPRPCWDRPTDRLTRLSPPPGAHPSSELTQAWVRGGPGFVNDFLKGTVSCSVSCPQPRPDPFS